MFSTFVIRHHSSGFREGIDIKLSTKFLACAKCAYRIVARCVKRQPKSSVPMH